MANELLSVYQNFVWRMESITPTCTKSAESFQRMDPQITDPSESTALTRSFSVAYDGSGRAGELEDLWARMGNHTFILEVNYVDLSWADLQEIVIQDRGDTIKTLRDPASWVGTSAAASDTQIGLFDRQYVRNEVINQGSFWTNRFEFACTVREVES